MAEKRIRLDEVKTSIDELLKHASDASISILKQFAKLQERRAKRLLNAKTRMEARLGKDNELVSALGRDASLAHKFRQSLKTTIIRNARRLRIKPDKFSVFGRVFNGEGNPSPGLRICFFIKDQTCNDTFGVTITDENGDFAFVFNKSSFAYQGDNPPDLYLRIENPEGRLLYSSKDKIPFRAGRAEYFEIILVKQT
jgi:hypothetical protein